MLAAFLSKISVPIVEQHIFIYVIILHSVLNFVLTNIIHQFSILYSWWFFVCFEALSGRAVVSPTLAHSKLLFTCSLMSQSGLKTTINAGF